MKFIFDEIFQQLEQSVVDHSHALSFGGAKSFEQYTEMVGRISGLRSSINVIHDIQEMVNKQEDDE